MAETLTVDNTPQTEIVGESEGVQLTADEQDSLKVGEEITEAQDQLLAGKYKTAEELEKAYGELQKKLGEKDTEDSETAGDTEDSTESKEETEEKEEAKETSPAVELINEASAEYWDNDQKLSPETIDKFKSLSTDQLLNAYLEVQKGAPNPNESSVPDLTEADINVVRNSVGGEAEYGKIVSWAKDNLPDSDAKAFDDLISTGNVGAIKLATQGLQAKYNDANGYEGRMLSGKPPKTSDNTFRSQAELVRAMNDPRYDDDPAYRQDVMEKLDRSDVQF